VPRKPKALTREQLQGRKEKAVRFLRDVKDEPELADEIEEESLEAYAEHRGIQLSNPERKPAMAKKSIEDYKDDNNELRQRIRDLEDENGELQDRLDSVAAALEPDEEDEEEEVDDDSGDDGD
jgi:hypothetical protein